ALGTGEGDLKQLQGARAERRNRPGEIQPPGPLEPGAIHLGYALAGSFKAFQPMLQSPGIMGAKVFHIQDRVVARLEYVHCLRERWYVRARKNSFSNPSAKNTFIAATDEVQQAAAGIADGTINHLAQTCIVGEADVLQHSYRHENIEL